MSALFPWRGRTVQWRRKSERTANFKGIEKKNCEKGIELGLFKLHFQNIRGEKHDGASYLGRPRKIKSELMWSEKKQAVFRPEREREYRGEGRWNGTARAEKKVQGGDVKVPEGRAEAFGAEPQDAKSPKRGGNGGAGWRRKLPFGFFRLRTVRANGFSFSR